MSQCANVPVPARGPMHAPALRLIAIGAVAVTALVAGVTGAVEPPDLEGALARISASIGAWTYLLVAAMAFLETGAFVGLIAPGETAIVLGGAIAAAGTVELTVMLALAWVAAALGDLVSFLLGRRLGRPFLVSHGGAVGITPARLSRVEAFFDSHGAKAILIGRFIGIVRAVAPFTAGASGMRLRVFVPWSLLGTGLWAATFTLLGFAFHESFSTAADAVTRVLLVIAALALGGLLWRHHRAGRRAAAV